MKMMGLLADAQGFSGMGNFGDLIRQMRKDRSWSQETLAQKIGKSKNRVSDIEQMDVPRVQPGTLGALAEAFGLDVPELRRLAEERRSRPQEAHMRSEEDALPMNLPSGLIAKIRAAATAVNMSEADYLSKLMDDAEKKKPNGARVRHPPKGAIPTKDGLKGTDGTKPTP
jgi:DNA-binding XRE family transcriptional regulator